MKIIPWFLGLVVLLAGCAGNPCPPCPPVPLCPVGEPAVTAPIGDVVVVCRPAENPKIPERLQAKLFDTAVNTGIGRATKLLQESLNELKPEAKLKVDGALGPKTRAALCGLSEADILAVYVEKQAAFYQSLVEKRPNQAKFLKGWLRRAAWVPE